MQLDPHKLKAQAERMRIAPQRDGVFLPKGTALNTLINGGNYAKLFKYGGGREANGFTAANGFANGKPRYVTSDITDGKVDGKTIFTLGAGVSVHLADLTATQAETVIRDVQNLARSLGLAYTQDEKSAHKLGLIGEWPAHGYGLGRTGSVASSVATAQHYAQLGDAGGLPRKLPFALVMDADKFDWEFELLDPAAPNLVHDWIVMLHLNSVIDLKG